MRKIFRLIAAQSTIVCLLTTPNPYGLRPAQAFGPLAAVALLDPAVIGSVVVAGGVIAGTASYYAPSVYQAGQVAVDSAAKFSRTLYHVEKLAVASGAEYLYGRAEELAISVGEAGSAVYDWIASHVSDLPTLGSIFQASIPAAGPYQPGAVDASHSPSAIPVGTVVSAPYNGIGSNSYVATRKAMVTGETWTGPVNTGTVSKSAVPGTYAQAPFFGFSNNRLIYYFSDPDLETALTYYYKYYWIAAVASTAEPTVWPSGVFDPGLFAAGIAAASPAAVAADVDAIIAANPGAVVGATPFTNAEKTAMANAAAVAAIAAQIADLEQQKQNDPSSSAIYDAQIANLKVQADLLSIENAKPQEPVDDIPYSPTSLGGAYTLPEVDFGARLSQFISAVKASSLFSLPNSAFSVPGGGSSQLTINGGDTFGVHVFDFAAMNSLWVILKSIVLTGFSFVAVRIVCLKGGSE